MKRIRPVAVAAVVALGLAGCVQATRQPPTTQMSVPATAPASGTTRPVASTTTTPEPQATTTTTDPAPTTSQVDLGPVTIVQAAPGMPVLVGGFMPLSGDDADLGLAQADAIQLAVTNFGEIVGHDVLLAPFEDTRCSVDGGRAAARGVLAGGASIGGSPVVGIVGPTCTAAAIDALPIVIDEGGFVLVSPSIADVDLTSDLLGSRGEVGRRGFFTVAPNALATPRAAARFAVEELGARRPAVVVLQGDGPGRLEAEVFAAATEELGVPIVRSKTVAENFRGVRITLRDLIGNDPDVIFFSFSAPEAHRRVFDALDSIGGLEEVSRLALEPALDQAVTRLEGSAGTFFLVRDDRPTGQDATATRYRDMRLEYERVYGIRPPVEAVRAYDATMLLLTAVASIAEDRGGTLVVDRRRIIDALEDVDTAGYFGRLDCDIFGDCLEARYRVYFHEEPGGLQATLAEEYWSNG